MDLITPDSIHFRSYPFHSLFIGLESYSLRGELWAAANFLWVRESQIAIGPGSPVLDMGVSPLGGPSFNLLCRHQMLSLAISYFSYLDRSNIKKRGGSFWRNEPKWRVSKTDVHSFVHKISILNQMQWNTIDVFFDINPVAKRWGFWCS